MEDAACAYSGAGCQFGAFGNDDMASDPYFIGQADGAVGVAALPFGVDEAVLVGVHEGAAPRHTVPVPKGDEMVADNQAAGTYERVVAKGQLAFFADFDAASCSNGTFAVEDYSATKVNLGAVVSEVGVLVGGEADLHQADTESVGLEVDMSAGIDKTGAV